jgi:hypothetical protein
MTLSGISSCGSVDLFGVRLRSLQSASRGLNSSASRTCYPCHLSRKVFSPGRFRRLGAGFTGRLRSFGEIAEDRGSTWRLVRGWVTSASACWSRSCGESGVPGADRAHRHPGARGVPAASSRLPAGCAAAPGGSVPRCPHRGRGKGCAARDRSPFSLRNDKALQQHTGGCRWGGPSSNIRPRESGISRAQALQGAPNRFAIDGFGLCTA